jgi:hypothetical protein
MSEATMTRRSIGLLVTLALGFDRPRDARVRAFGKMEVLGKK